MVAIGTFTKILNCSEYTAIGLAGKRAWREEKHVLNFLDSPSGCNLVANLDLELCPLF